jgi:hypothetical protein
MASPRGSNRRTDQCGEQRLWLDLPTGPAPLLISRILFSSLASFLSLYRVFGATGVFNEVLDSGYGTLAPTGRESSSG